MKRYLKPTVTFLIMAVMVFSFTAPVHAANDGINEKMGVPIVVYGDTLSDSQKEEVRELLEVTDPEAVEEYAVTGEDIANYIDGDPNSRMFSSAKITREEEGTGLTINIVTPDNITQVTNEMYANALLTAGVENATVDVVSPVQVSGHSALTGIYKAYDAEGEELDKERMELANDELDVATDLADKEGLNQEKVSELLTEIKQAIADQNPATKEEIEQIVEEQLNNLDISLSEEDRQMLTDLFNRMRDLDINFDNVKNQLDEIASKVQDLINDEGFWNRVEAFFSNLARMIGNFFEGIFN
ncbi:Uncharacterized protein YpuA, DUF1002 family [Lentibacillus halodurans]|uniref:Uncharacterized protein YpuA, DUF1002 family n=1 Tax=Lentibacillus halodurans TaxID=237679 RepID=A0A1I0X751_9BACI|nr:DUF1002 domain-containing protein [Lentibacillus halodurans]SFA96835.1 Uncharacterized protein YpuA, DUF1002 family [Lentibacillus halodurans]